MAFHPTKAYLQNMSMYLRFRVSIHKNLLFSHLNNDTSPRFTIFTNDSLAKQMEDNIYTMIQAIHKTDLFPRSVHQNKITQYILRSLGYPEQRADLLSLEKKAREILETTLITAY